MRFLLEYGADVDVRDNTGRRAIDYAKESNFTSCINELLRYSQVPSACCEVCVIWVSGSHSLVGV